MILSFVKGSDTKTVYIYVFNGKVKTLRDWIKVLLKYKALLTNVTNYKN